MTRPWLVDKSAYARFSHAEEAEAWIDRIGRGLVRISRITMMELGFSARDATSWRHQVEAPPMALMPIEPLSPRIEIRALEVQGLLAERAQHRAASIPDLLIAATAELAGLTVLHVDKDFELIAAVTGQLVERLAGDF